MRASEMDRVAVATIGDVLADTMNMARAEAKEEKPVDVAAITGVRQGNVGSFAGPFGFDEGHSLTLRWDDGRAILAARQWIESGWQQRLTMAQAILAIFNCLPNADGSTLRWLFSGKETGRDYANEMLALWMEDGAPPVMDLIDFLILETPEDRSIRTRGLFDFVGYEIEAMIGGEGQSELPRMVGRLAQESLRTGPVQGEIVIGPDDRRYQLQHLQTPGALPLLIRIIPADN